MMIFYLCLAYYFVHEYFERCQDGMEISAEQSTVTQIGDSGNKYLFSWCNQWIDANIPQIAKWKLRINKLIHKKDWFSQRSVMIRIVSDEAPEYFGKKYEPCYRFVESATTWTNGKGQRLEASIPAETRPAAFAEVDDLWVILNTKDATIGILRNDNDLRILWKNIQIGSDIRYKLCISSILAFDQMKLCYKLNK